MNYSGSLLLDYWFYKVIVDTFSKKFKKKNRCQLKMHDSSLVFTFYEPSLAPAPWNLCNIVLVFQQMYIHWLPVHPVLGCGHRLGNVSCPFWVSVVWSVYFGYLCLCFLLNYNTLMSGALSQALTIYSSITYPVSMYLYIDISVSLGSYLY